MTGIPGIVTRLGQLINIEINSVKAEMDAGERDAKKMTLRES